MNRRLFKTSLIPAVACLAGFGLMPTARGAVLASESFQYAGGAFIQNQSGGTGFSSNWLGASGFFNEDARAFNNLTYAGLTSTGLGARMLRGDFRDNHRILDTSPTGPFADYLNANGKIGLDGTNLWIAYLYQDNTPSLAGGFGAIRLYADASDPVSTDPGGDFIDIGGNAFNYDDGNVNYVVGNLKFDAAGDSLDLYINPDLSAPPGAPTATINYTDDIEFEVLEIGGRYFSSVPEVTFDEIVIGELAEDVGFAPIPEPGSLMLVAVGAGLALVRRRHA